MQKQHYHGHRERLREQGLEGFQDYEALELLLIFVARQQDLKPVAKSLVERFGSFKNVLDAPTDELQSVKSVGPAAVTLLHLIKQAAARYLQQTRSERFSPSSPEALIQYCIVSMGAESNERFRAICLDSNFAIVDEQYILRGRVDLLLGEDDKLEILDFKSQPRPQNDDRRLEHYYQQLLIYAYILEQRYARYPERLTLYWTGEAQRDDALMVFPYEPRRVDKVGAYFDSVVAQTLARDFSVKQRPERKVCSECDFRGYC